MLIQKNDPLCGKCLIDKNCDCLCHVKDVVFGSHYEIHEEMYDKETIPIVDLDKFRH